MTFIAYMRWVGKSNCGGTFDLMQISKVFKESRVLYFVCGNI